MYHFDHDSAQHLVRFDREIREDIGFVGLQQLESDRQMVILEHRLIVVHQRQLKTYDAPRRLNATER